MRLYEYQGKELFSKYSIPIPTGRVLSEPQEIPQEVVVKAQVLSGDRLAAGGIVFADAKASESVIKELLSSKINNEKVEKVLVENKLDIDHEYYISISFSTDTRSPVLSLSPHGGTGTKEALVIPINPLEGINKEFLSITLNKAEFSEEDISAVSEIILNLWNLFVAEHCLLAEINPLIKTKSGEFIAGDSKIILDDEVIKPHERRIVDMGGDIAVIASGGGASVLNIDALQKYGGKPANYTEYSGNPSAETVSNLTKEILSKPGIKGCWVVGVIANFTDINETMRGFMEGLKTATPKPTYPIVIRRDGPNKEEAFVALRKFANDEGYNIHLYDSKTPMDETAKILMELVKNDK